MEKNVYKKRALLAIGAVLALGALSACGNSKEVKDIEKAKTVTPVGIFAPKEERIWYQTSGMGKDADVSNIFVSKGNKVTLYDGKKLSKGYKLGDFSKLSDGEILELLEKESKEYAQSGIEAHQEEEIQKVKDALAKGWFDKEISYKESKEYEKTILDEARKETNSMTLDLRGLKPKVEEYLKKAEGYGPTLAYETQPQVGVITDSTGNQTNSEIVQLRYEEGRFPALHRDEGAEVLSKVLWLVESLESFEEDAKQNKDDAFDGLKDLIEQISFNHDEWLDIADDKKEGPDAVRTFGAKTKENLFEVVGQGEEKKVNLRFGTGTMVSTGAVYDSTYMYILGQDNLATRVKSEKILPFALDTPKTDGVIVDGEDFR